MAAYNYIDAATLKAKLLARLGLDSFRDNTFWDSIVADALVAAANDIRQAFVGFDSDVLVQWDRGAEYQTDIGLYWAFVHGGLSKDYPSEFILLLNRRGELAGMELTIDGEVQVVPDDALTGGASGCLDTSHDVFQMDDAI